MWQGRYRVGCTCQWLYVPDTSTSCAGCNPIVPHETVRYLPLTGTADQVKIALANHAKPMQEEDKEYSRLSRTMEELIEEVEGDVVELA